MTASSRRPRITVADDEMITVREAMRELNRLVAALEAGTKEKYVLIKGTEMQGVLLSVREYARLRGN